MRYSAQAMIEISRTDITAALRHLDVGLSRFAGSNNTWVAAM